MRFSLPSADIYVPDGVEAAAALARTTHLAIAAHQDDIEIMAADGILRAFRQPDRWFTGVVVTDGAGSPRDGVYEDCTDEQMRGLRRREQRKAALIGEYAAVVQLDHPSAAVRRATDRGVVDDIAEVLRATRPEVVYTHNLADKHDTHVAVALRAIAAIRLLPAADRPGRLYGCEVWRDLDWMPDEEKVAFDLSAHESLQAALIGVFDSQICGGKRYDLATMGRRKAHATYFASHGTDVTTGLSFGMDLTPLIADPARDPGRYVLEFIQRFAQEATDRVQRLR